MWVLQDVIAGSDRGRLRKARQLENTMRSDVVRDRNFLKGLYEQCIDHNAEHHSGQDHLGGVMRAIMDRNRRLEEKQFVLQSNIRSIDKRLKELGAESEG